MSITKEMAKALENETGKRKIGSIQEVMRAILGEYFLLREKEPKKKKEVLPVIKYDNHNPLAH